MIIKNQKVQKVEVEINQRLRIYQNRQVLVKQYCEVCRAALSLSEDMLSEQYTQYLRNNKKSEKGNHRILAGFLCSPNIEYKIEELHYKEKRDQRKLEEEAMRDAGKRIIGAIAYAWDHYLRLIKEKKEKKNVKQAQLNDIFKAKKRLWDILKEMQDNRYHWQNYTKQLLASKHYAQKQMKEQHTLITLLQNMLQTQIEKMKDKSRNIPQREVENENQNQKQQNAEQRPDFGYLQSQQNRRDLKQLIDVSKYFNSKNSNKTLKLSTSDTITRCQQQRQFSTTALRYNSSAHPK